jgi:putative intracellular protease/amidase
MLISFTNAQNSKVLFVLSTADTLLLNDGEKLRQTGVFLNEFYLAYHAISEAGYEIEIATPNGQKATIDHESINDKYWKNHLEKKKQALTFVKTNLAYNHPITLTKAIEKQEEYIGMVIPGGQGLMIDLINDDNIPVLLTVFAQTNKPTGLICHAPSLLLTLPKEKHPYQGFKVNAVSPFEEMVIENFIMKGKPEKRKIAKQLKRKGMKYKQARPKANYAVKDRNLVTSQNPFSSTSFNTLYLEALSEYLNSTN